MNGPFSTEGFQIILPTELYSRRIRTHTKEDREARKPQEMGLHQWARKDWEAN